MHFHTQAINLLPASILKPFRQPFTVKQILDVKQTQTKCLKHPLGKRGSSETLLSIITAPFTSTFFWMDNMTSNSNSNIRFWETAAVSHPLAWPHTWCQANSVYSHTLVASDTCQVTSRDQRWLRRPERHQDVPQSLVHQPSSAQGLGHPARDPRHRHSHFEPTQ